MPKISTRFVKVAPRASTRAKIFGCTVLPWIRLLPRSPHTPSSTVSDDDLHASTRRLVGRSNQLLAALLAHLAEVEARGIHRERACASLYTYCIYELRMTEDQAFRRARASKIARQFPILVPTGRGR